MHENSFKSTVLAALALALAPALSQAYEAGVESDNAPVAATTPALIPMTAQVTAKLPTLDNRLQKTDRLLKNLSDNSDPLREADVWGRIRSGYAIPDINNQLVANHVNWYATRPDHLARTTARASRYIFHVVQELEKRGMPTNWPCCRLSSLPSTRRLSPAPVRPACGNSCPPRDAISTSSKTCSRTSAAACWPRPMRH